MAYHNDNYDFLSEELNKIAHFEEEVVITSTQQTVSILQTYISDKSLSEIFAAQEKVTRKKGHIYQFFASYDTFEEAEAVIKAEEMWSNKREHKPDTIIVNLNYLIITYLNNQLNE